MNGFIFFWPTHRGQVIFLKCSELYHISNIINRNQHKKAVWSLWIPTNQYWILGMEPLTTIYTKFASDFVHQKNCAGTVPSNGAVWDNLKIKN